MEYITLFYKLIVYLVVSTCLLILPKFYILFLSCLSCNNNDNIIIINIINNNDNKKWNNHKQARFMPQG